MRTLLKISMPVGPANRAINDGSLPKLFQAAIEQLRPEASYFYAENGRRTAVLVFDLADPAQIPSVSEPFFSKLDAAVELFPVMTAADMKAGVARAMREPFREPVAA